MASNVAGRLGICRRSGHLAIGTDAVLGWMRDGKACVVLTAADLSQKTEKEIRFVAEKHPVSLRQMPLSKDEVGQALGLLKPVGVVATDDRGFATAFEKDCPDRQEEDAL